MFKLLLRRYCILHNSLENTYEDRVDVFKDINDFFEKYIEMTVPNCEIIFEYYTLKLNNNLKFGEFK